MSRRERNDSTIGNRRAAADHGRCFAPLRFERPGCGLKGGRAGIEADRRRSAFMREGHARISRQAAFDEAMQAREEFARILSGNQAEGQLGGRLRRDHRLGAGSAIAAYDAVDLDGRPRPELLEHAEAPFAGGVAQAHAAEKSRLVETEPAPGGKLGGGGRRACRRRTRRWRCDHRHREARRGCPTARGAD